MSFISTRDLALLPNAAWLRDLLRTMAMLDAILCPEWDGRYYSFDAGWAKREEMGSMRNGHGDDLFALFNSYGCFLKGFVHDSPAATSPIEPAEHYRNLPQELESCISEPAFTTENVTFCIWRSFGDSRWAHNPIALPSGDDPDGSGYLLSPLDGKPETQPDTPAERGGQPVSSIMRVLDSESCGVRPIILVDRLGDAYQ